MRRGAKGSWAHRRELSFQRDLDGARVGPTSASGTAESLAHAARQPRKPAARGLRPTHAAILVDHKTEIEPSHPCGPRPTRRRQVALAQRRLQARQGSTHRRPRERAADFEPLKRHPGVGGRLKRGGRHCNRLFRRSRGGRRGWRRPGGAGWRRSSGTGRLGRNRSGARRTRRLGRNRGRACRCGRRRRGQGCSSACPLRSGRRRRWSRASVDAVCSMGLGQSRHSRCDRRSPRARRRPHARRRCARR